MKPNLLLLGAQKSASTLLGWCLNQHPEVEVRGKEDTSFEDPEFPTALPQPTQSKIKYFAIRRPDYFGNFRYMERMARTLPEARIVITLRHPLDRFISAYFHYMRYGLLPIRSLSHSMAKFLPNAIPTHISAYRQVLDYGCYGTCFENLLKFYPSTQILVLRDDQWIAKYPVSLEPVFRWLDLLPCLLPEAMPRPQENVYSLSRLRWLKLHFRISYRYDRARSKSYTIPEQDRSWLGNKWNFFVKKMDQKILTRFLANRPPTLPPLLREYLAKFYLDELIKTQSLMPIDLSDWVADLNATFQSSEPVK